MKFEDMINQVIHADCLEVMRGIPNAAVDLVLTDPPYMISSEVRITRGRNSMKFKGSDISHDFGEWDKFNSIDEFLVWTYKWLDEAVRCLRPGGMLISYFDKDKINFMSHHLQDKYKFKIKGYYADLKSNPVPQARKVKWMNGWEELGMWQKPDGKLTYNYELGQEKDWSVRAIVGHTTKVDGAREHPCQKPIGLMTKFIRYWSSPGDLVLDPFCGSGPVIVSCKNTGRRFIGIDKDEKYCAVASNRLNQVSENIFK